MGWFSKKEEVPEIPELPKGPISFPSSTRQMQTDDLPDLPSFSEDSFSNDMNQNIVKSTINDTNEDSIQDIPKELPKNNTLGGNFLIPPRPVREVFIPEPPKKIEIKSVKNVPTQSKYEEQNLNEPIFVRLDKFQDAQKNLENIKDKIAEIESTIKSIKDVKSKEDEEISKWIEDTENLKSLLAEIDEDIFGKI